MEAALATFAIADPELRSVVDRKWTLVTLEGYRFLMASAGMVQRPDGVWEFTAVAAARFRAHRAPTDRRRRRYQFDRRSGLAVTVSKYAGQETDYPRKTAPQFFLCPVCRHVNSFPQNP